MPISQRPLTFNGEIMKGLIVMKLIVQNRFVKKKKV